MEDQNPQDPAEFSETIRTAARIAGLAAVDLEITYGTELAALPSSIRTGLLIDGVVAHLVGHGILAAGENLNNDGWIPLGLGPAESQAFSRKVADALERRAIIQAGLPRREGGG